MEHINALIDGFKAFKTEYKLDREGKYKELAEYGPHSRILMIACCDSRADPAIITSSSAGDLMVIRNIANLVPPYSPANSMAETQAALEFAISYLSIEHIIIMGHSRCGGIRSLLTRMLDESEPAHPLDQWTAIAEPAARSVLEEMPTANLDDQTCACSRKALTTSLDNLRSYPWVVDALQSDAIKLHAWYFNLASGDLEQYSEKNDCFIAL